MISEILRGARHIAVSLARQRVLKSLSLAVKNDALVVAEGEERTVIGKPLAGVDPVMVTVIEDVFWLRMMTSTDLAFGEAYMYGEIQISNLAQLMELWLVNRQDMENLAGAFELASQACGGLLRTLLGTSVFQSRRNVITGYDTSNTLFRAFLSAEMMYSCPIWSDTEGGVNGDLHPGIGPTTGDLEAAQMRKIHKVIKEARIRKGHRVLEIGSGWGGFAIEAAKTTGCIIDTLTLSVEQKKLADERIQSEGLQDLITVHLLDYRDTPTEFEGKFDALVSIEMLEHVGPLHYDHFFKIVDTCLKPDVSTAVVTSTTRPESRFTKFQAHDFPRKYFWPNGSLPSASILIESAHRASQGRLALQTVENHGPHYARALREWARRFQINVTPEVIEQIKLDQSERGLVDVTEVEAFKRKWHFMFAYGSSGYVPGYVSCHMLTFTREANALNEIE